MKRLYFLGVLLAALFFVGAGGASALISTDGSPIAQKVHLRGVMPTMRIIYVDPQSNVLMVTGNTDENVTPVVALPDSPNLLPLSPFINEQYQKIINANGGSLTAGLNYYPAGSPVTSAGGLNI